jgi:Na+/H+-dicarboxylate symporter
VVLASLVGGLAFGIAVHRSGDPALGRLAVAVGVIGQVWVAALRMTVVPLVIAVTLAAIVGAKRQTSIGALGLKALALFVAMHIAATALALTLVPAALELQSADPAAAASFRSPVSASAPVAPPSPPNAVTAGDWLTRLIPTNIFASAASGEILPILLFTVLFGLALRRLDGPSHELLQRLLEGLAFAMMTLVRWVLMAMPVGVFALCAMFASHLGSEAIGVLAFFIALLSGMLLLATLLLYPLSSMLGRVSLGTFARAAAPAQLLAVTTRSSLASLPALVQGGREHLALPEAGTGFVLPLCVATFKIDYMISGLVRLLFVAHVLGIALGPLELTTFILTLLLLSFGAAGVPGLGGVRSLPAYLAAGLPLEAVLIVIAVDAIPDVFATLANVTADMSAATILSRRERTPSGAKGMAAAATP